MASTTEPQGEIQEVSEDVFTETLRYKLWVLKVSIHCDACAKKVSKVLKEIDGVYITEVNIVQQRVTVIGNVEAEDMIKTLKKKTSKRFEVIWPEPKSNPKDEVPSKPQSQERQSAPAAVISDETKPSQGGGGGGGDKSKGKQPVKGVVVEVKESGGGVTKKNYEVGSSSNSKDVLEGEVVKPHEGRGGGLKIKEPQTGTLPRQSPTPVVAEKQSGDCENEAVEVKSGGAHAGNGGGGGKKKGQEQNVNVNVAEGQTGGVAPSTGSPPGQSGPLPQPQPQGHPNVQTTMTSVQRPMPIPPYRVPQPQRQVYDHSYNPRQQQHEHPQPRQQQQYEHPQPRQQQQYDYSQPRQQYDYSQPRQQYEFFQPRQQQYDENPWSRQQQYDENPWSRQQQQQYFTPMPAMNYHAAYPSASYVARHAAQPVYSETHTYAHWGLGNEVTPEASQLDNLPLELPSLPPQPYPPHAYGSSDSSDTFAFFSDENPNACSIM